MQIGGKSDDGFAFGVSLILADSLYSAVLSAASCCANVYAVEA